MRRRTAGALAVLALPLLPVACSTHVTTDANSGATAAVGSGSIKADAALTGRTLTVSSKDFTESIVLGQITKLALQAAGAKVKDKTNIKGSANTRAALTSKEVDLYWDYTGTGWIIYLKHTDPVKGAAAQFKAVADEDRAKNGVRWLTPAPADNTFALAVLSAKARQWKLTSLSDFAAFARSRPADATVCLESEFSTRNDGWPGLIRAYGIDIPKSNIKLVDTGVVYTETAKGTTCNFGEVFATDGRITNLKLTTLEDDRQFFPVYNPALTLRTETADSYPSIGQIMAPIAARLDNATLRGLNAQVAVDGLPPDRVAEGWLKKNGFIG
ncbi:glycine betaine ABC transporter substrate-binding protein (plasmid) [Streptomyces clavuligerus]|uniref:glycine betaine ABC transporter substrate-binding protein n=1 Tax=Streptomyces clavuligerus TaxID=1901 RepID=UPI00017FF12D|nr:glycine betaine ABC transporter substrate-binding protein [Streptomyces clavuligerus]ANW22677.1 glycine/betaine ABC transporter substrate-binding protein [Streptomyces clavuligerus]AXU17546.1 glycine betaine ABC transporter substrate-binding protein [Streptomyces clavuligerus]EDY47522.1 conserved hypothetical protein [Streptomyces clavuligerus]MBY6307062.1 glycine betaine ABC transporter substrate-binding protein [Streptomyces clavuligerus]QCS10945.1 glycine/betaine ABC transporter substrat